MRVIAVNRFYRPDRSATAQILGDLAEHLAEAGHEVAVITSRLRYEDASARLPKRERLNGVEVRRVWTYPSGRFGIIGRTITYATFYVTAFLALLALARKGDIVIAKTDPPLICVPAGLAARLRGARLVNWCQDLYPEVAEALGVAMARGPLGRVLRALRNRSLKTAALNVVLNSRMAAYVHSQGVEPTRTQVLPNWCDRNVRPVPPDANPLREAWGLNGKRVIGYSGNLGRAHLPEKVAELVRATLDLENIVWLFIGGGSGTRHVEQVVEETGAANVMFQDYQPTERLSESLSVPDVHLISLNPACEGLIMPSKLYGVIAAGRPAVFLGARDGAVARDIERFGLGISLDTDKPGVWRERLHVALSNSPSGPAHAAAHPATTAKFGAHERISAWTGVLASLASGREQTALARESA